MKTRLPVHLLVAACAATASVARAERASANYAVTAETADAGGQRAASANYTSDGSATHIVGLSEIAAPVQTAKHGYIGQLYEVTGLVLNAAAPSVNEGETLQLGAWQSLDDATFLSVNPGSVTWSAPSPPIASVNAGGLATAEIVYQDTPAVVEGAFAGFTGMLNLTVLNVNADDFGFYAGDGVGDDWQVQFFGFDNPDAAPGLDPDGDGGINAFEFTAGLIPTDPNSVFYLRLEAVPGEPGQRNIIFGPRLEGRSYVVETTSVLDDPVWEPLGPNLESDNGEERTVTDLDAMGVKFYRVEITRP